MTTALSKTFGVLGGALLLFCGSELVAQQALFQTASAPLDTGAHLSAMDTATVTVPLKYRVVRNWKFRMPAESFAKIGSVLPVGHDGGTGFSTELSGTALTIDTDGDGKADVKADPADATVVLKGKRSGQPFKYAVRLALKANGWNWASSGVYTTKVDGVKVTLIDQDNDGRFDGIGKDAMVVGRGKVASFLSSAININGKLRKLAVSNNAEGHPTLVVSPFDGKAGRLDLQKNFTTKAKLLSAVIKSTDGKYSFEMAKAPEGGMSVPAGKYILHNGELGLGEGRLGMRQGRSKAIEVAAQDTATPTWGDGPARAEFAFKQQGGEVAFSPDAVWYFGAAGEEYFGWTPLGKSPRFKISDRTSGKELAVTQFPGSC